MWRTHSCAMPLSFPNSAHLHKWWGGRPRPHPAPWPACRWWQAPDSSREERDEGVPRGPGGPPSNYAESAALRKLSGIAHECVRHSITAERLGETRVTGVFKLGKPTGPEIEPLAGMAAPPKQAGRRAPKWSRWPGWRRRRNRPEYPVAKAPLSHDRRLLLGLGRGRRRQRVLTLDVVLAAIGVARALVGALAGEAS